MRGKRVVGVGEVAVFKVGGELPERSVVGSSRMVVGEQEGERFGGC